QLIPKRRLVQPTSLTNWAGIVAAITSQKDAHMHLVGLARKPLEPLTNPPVIGSPALARPLVNHALLGGGQLLVGTFPRNTVFDAKLLELRSLPRGLGAPPCTNRSVGETQPLIRNDLISVNPHDATETPTVFASSKRRFIREVARSRRQQGARTLRTGQTVTKMQRRRRGILAVDPSLTISENAGAARKSADQCLFDAGTFLGRTSQAVQHDVHPSCLVGNRRLEFIQ